jgi:MscS family membrane protein
MMDGTHWLSETYFVMPTWKWIALIGAFAVGVALFSVFRYSVRKIKGFRKQDSSKQGFWFYYSKLHIEGPATWILLCLFWFFAIESLELPVRLDKYVTLAVKLIFAFNIVRLAYIGMDALGSILKDYTAKTPSTLDDHLAPLAVKSAKVLVVILGVLIALQNFGVNVMSLLAGLGLGGLALALAAQDSAANLIGSIMIILDRPFSIGDAIKVVDVEGTVESIGFRSTRIRTYYNSLITLPNSTMAKEKIDNMGVRPFRRIRQVLGLHYDTPPDAIEHFCSRVKYIISQDPMSVKETIQVNFNQFADSTLNVLVVFHLQTADTNEELMHTQRIFCDIILAAKEMGVIFAYPTQTVYYMQGIEQSSTPAQSPNA